MVQNVFPLRAVINVFLVLQRMSICYCFLENQRTSERNVSAAIETTPSVVFRLASYSTAPVGGITIATESAISQHDVTILALTHCVNCVTCVCVYHRSQTMVDYI